MKVHPVPKKRNITLRSDLFSAEGNAPVYRQKKLRRLPHIFEKVLELPFHSDADVNIEETEDCFRFMVDTEDISGEVRTDTIEIHPGVTKIVIRDCLNRLGRNWQPQLAMKASWWSRCQKTKLNLPGRKLGVKEDASLLYSEFLSSPSSLIYYCYRFLLWH